MFGQQQMMMMPAGLPHKTIYSPETTTTTPTRASADWPQYGAGARGGGSAHFTLIANVPYDTVRQDLVVEFRKYGRVELAMVVCDEASRHPHKEWTSTAGYAFVRFSQRSEAAAAIQAASLGLITIRGTRVRADWARKDSYAKRGRVSPSQGAPLLGPQGMPDGIEQLRNLQGGDLTPTTVYPGASTTRAAYAEEATPSFGRLNTLPTPISYSPATPARRMESSAPHIQLPVGKCCDVWTNDDNDTSGQSSSNRLLAVEERTTPLDALSPSSRDFLTQALCDVVPVPRDVVIPHERLHKALEFGGFYAPSGTWMFGGSGGPTAETTTTASSSTPSSVGGKSQFVSTSDETATAATIQKTASMIVNDLDTSDDDDQDEQDEQDEDIIPAAVVALDEDLDHLSAGEGGSA